MFASSRLRRTGTGARRIIDEGEVHAQIEQWMNEEGDELMLGDDEGDLFSDSDDTDSSDDEADIDMNEEQGEPMDEGDKPLGDDEVPPNYTMHARPPRKLLTRKRKVNSIDAADDLENYDPIELSTFSGEPTETLTGYLGPKNKKGTPTVSWTNTPPPVTGQPRRCDVINNGRSGNNKPGEPTRKARNVSSMAGAWSSMCTDKMIDLIYNKTVKAVEAVRSLCPEAILASDKYTYLKVPTREEIKALIGLIYARGLLGQSMHDVSHLFGKWGHPIFGAATSRDRMKFLIHNLTFDDPLERTEKWAGDRFAACRDLFELFNNSIDQVLFPSEFLTIDETLYPMRHQIAFKQFNPFKPAKYGILFKSINDARFPFTYKVSVYASKPTAGTGDYYIEGIQAYVKDLVNRLNKNELIGGRNISMDRLYGSVEIAKWLLETHCITTTTTMMVNRVGIPDEMKSAKGRAEFSKSVHYNEPDKNLALCTYTVKTKSKGMKNVLMLTTRRPIFGQTVDDKKQKPALYKFYDFTKGGTDIVDQKIGRYSTKTVSQRWSLVAFYYMLDTLRVNATTLYAKATRTDPRKVDSFKVGWELVLELVLPYIRARSKNGLTTAVVQKINTMLGVPAPAPQSAGPVIAAELPRDGPPRKCPKCRIALQGKDYSVNKNKLYAIKMQCQRCGVATCTTHSRVICDSHIV